MMLSSNIRNQMEPKGPQHHQSPEGDKGQPARGAAPPPSQQSMMQDMFVENYRRPSSRVGGEPVYDEDDPDRIEVSEQIHVWEYEIVFA